jgi:hypothetical protein
VDEGLNSFPLLGLNQNCQLMSAMTFTLINLSNSKFSDEEETRMFRLALVHNEALNWGGYCTYSLIYPQWLKGWNFQEQVELHECLYQLDKSIYQQVIENQQAYQRMNRQKGKSKALLVLLKQHEAVLKKLENDLRKHFESEAIRLRIKDIAHFYDTFPIQLFFPADYSPIDSDWNHLLKMIYELTEEHHVLLAHSAALETIWRAVSYQQMLETSHDSQMIYLDLAILPDLIDFTDNQLQYTREELLPLFGPMNRLVATCAEKVRQVSYSLETLGTDLSACVADIAAERAALQPKIEQSLYVKQYYDHQPSPVRYALRLGILPFGKLLASYYHLDLVDEQSMRFGMQYVQQRADLEQCRVCLYYKQIE